MRRLALIFLLALTGCGDRSARVAADLCRQGRDLLRGQQYKTILARVEDALRHAPQSTPCYWRLRLLRAEILAEQRENAAAQALDFKLPPGPQWTEEWARYRLCQASIEFRLRHDPQAALQRLDQARTFAQTIGAAGLLDEIELRRASVFIRQNKLAEAEAKLHEVLDDAVRRKDAYLEMKARGNIGFLLSDYEFRYEEAIPWDEAGLRMARALGAADDEARNNLNLGWCAYRLRDLDKAQRYFQVAALGFEQTGNRRDRQVCLGDMAGILLDKHEYRAAAEAYEGALRMAVGLDDRAHRASWLDDLAEIAIETGDWDRAERYNNQAWNLWKSDGHGEDFSVVKAGYIAAGRGDFAKADELFRTVIDRPGGDPIPVLRAHSGRAFMLATAGRNRDAEAEYRATDAAMERQRTALASDQDRLAYFAGQIEFYQEYVDYIMAQGRPKEALAIAESSRARALLDKLRLTHGRLSAGTAASFERAAAASGRVLLSYWLAPDRSFLWAVSGSEVRVFTLPGEARIRAMVKAYDDLIQAVRDPRDSDNPAGRQLYQTLIAPAAGLLAKDAAVVIVPDGSLAGLNFETLPVPGATPHYWIEDVTVSVTPSLDLLMPTRKTGRRPAPPECESRPCAAARNTPPFALLMPTRKTGRRPAPSLLLIGNPVSPVAQYPDLEFAGQEIDAIREDLPAFRQVVRERSQAAPAVYAGSHPAGFDYIHFVAHAVADAKEPLESAVILSRSGKDYKLRAEDVLKTPLHATLVTISACRSAGGRVYAGEGLVGFPWAFLEAGARNVIAGLWDVGDRSTADLMARLYAGIGRGAAPSRALRDAKLALIHAGGAWGKPYYWGPFELFTRQAR
ncbi:MAG TPA: CHAT domain-containing protein [Bryobacteraceae bacterium]|nr:CHAT domain-containing protein [Bryobacteraceae bacterium]